MAAKRQPNSYADGSSESKEGVVFSFMDRQRLREVSQEAHGLMVERLRRARRQGSAASPGSLAAEIRALAHAVNGAKTQHGAVQTVATVDVRNCYVAVAVSCLILAERVTRPAELPRGSKSQTRRYEAPNFSVPRR